MDTDPAVASSAARLKGIVNNHEVPLGSVALIGSSSNCDVVLTGATVSAKHALLALGEGKAWVYDLKSKNGSFVNGTQVHWDCRLQDADRVSFGTEEFVFLWTTPVPVAAEPLEPNTKGRQLPPAWLSLPAGSDKTQYLSDEEWQVERHRWAVAPGTQPDTYDRNSPLLVFLKEGEPSNHVRLSVSDPIKGQEWVIGSDRACEIRVDLPGVSRRHARISNYGGRWKLTSLLPVNGTFVNGKRVLVSYLRQGDLISFGAVECAFHLPEPLADGARSSPALRGFFGRLRQVLLFFRSS